MSRLPTAGAPGFPLSGTQRTSRRRLCSTCTGRFTMRFRTQKSHNDRVRAALLKPSKISQCHFKQTSLSQHPKLVQFRPFTLLLRYFYATVYARYTRYLYFKCCTFRMSLLASTLTTNTAHNILDRSLSPPDCNRLVRYPFM